MNLKYEKSVNLSNLIYKIVNCELLNMDCEFCLLCRQGLPRSHHLRLRWAKKTCLPYKSLPYRNALESKPLDLEVGKKNIAHPTN